jgi:hypothetical protein
MPTGFEDDGRKRPFHHLAHEIEPADFVDLESGQRSEFAVALDRAVVDVVVAEPAEIEVGESVAALAVGAARAVRSQIDECGIGVGIRD